MAATTVTSTMLGELRKRIVSLVSYGRYKIGDTWYKADINSKGVQGNGSVHVTFYVRREGGGSTPASRFQLCGADGAVLAERVEDVAFAQYMDAILYRFKFGVNVGDGPVA